MSIAPGTGIRRASHLRRGNKTGFAGVIYRPHAGLYEAFGWLGGKRVYLGRYEDVLDAGVAASDYRLRTKEEREAIRAAGNRAAARAHKRVWANMTSEERKARIRHAAEGQTTEERKAAQKKNPLTTKERQIFGKAGQLKRPRHERRESALRAWETRRAKTA